MILFSSERERRLWLGTLAIVVAIYSTLGLAGTIAAELENRDLIDAAFGAGLVVLLAAIVALTLRWRPRGIEIGAGLGVFVVYLWVFLRMAIPEERSHLIEYGLVAAFAHAALVERVANGREVPRPAVLAAAITMIIGVLDECLQAFLPSRVFDVRDIAFNVLAAVMGAGASAVLTGARRVQVRG